MMVQRQKGYMNLLFAIARDCCPLVAAAAAVVVGVVGVVGVVAVVLRWLRCR